MNTPSKLLTALVASALLAGCTLKDVEAPALAGPSTLGYSILLTASTDTLMQDGVSTATIEITARDGAGQLVTGRPLRAEIRVGGIVQDFGSLNTKTPVTGGTLRYTAPPASQLAAGQVAQTITIAVTPTDSGDFSSELSRGVDIRLIPQGVILPTNPGLAPAFTVTPASPQAFSTASFDASATTNGGVACNNACSYSWNFGDGTSGAGITTTHDYRTAGSFVAVLTVTDSRGAQATLSRTVTVAQPAAPTIVDFTFSPTPAFTNQAIFFTAAASRAAPGRTLVKYEWDFGKGTTGSGITVTKEYETAAVYTVTLKVTDDAGAFATTSKTVSVTSPTPVASFTVTPSPPTVGANVVFNASASTGPSTIVTYSWSFGTGSSPSTASGQVVNATYSSPGAKAVTLTVTDSQGRTASVTQTVTVGS